jgi:hypothetical protein
MGARETSVNLALALDRFFGLFVLAFGLLIFDSQHFVGTGMVCLGLFTLATFFPTSARVRLEGSRIIYRRWFRWRAVAYSEIRDCGEFWIYGYIKANRFTRPWGRIYLVRPSSSQSLFGLDKEIISTIRSRAHI